ncbi:MAG: efflux RND transporter periplasmic adaptor subunit [Paludibacteraceae bacterium]|nr:efflux RND transporter periplasmic adaptor subunit [Paludibacteraceae bacterium]
MKKALIIALILPTLILSSCGKKTQEEQDDAPRTEQVKITRLEKSEVERTIEVSANLQGYETVNIAPSLTGHIEHIYFEEGANVSKGQMVVRMDQNQYRTTKLAFDNLTTEMQRMDALKETGSVSQQTYDQTKVSYDQTKEQLDFLQLNTYVASPISGTVSAKNYEDGELYAGQPILTITMINTLKCLMSVPESYYPRVKEGMSVNITTDIYPDETFPAVVETIFPTVDATTHTFQIKLKIPNASRRLRPGMYVKSTLELGKEQTIVVPYQAVLKLVGANDRYVFLNSNGVAKRVAVTLGQRYDDKIEIFGDDIVEGAELVTTGESKLVDGTPLNIVQ